MAYRLLVSTRKGLFTITRTGVGRSPWAISKVDFLADNVSLALFDNKRDGHIYAARPWAFRREAASVSARPKMGRVRRTRLSAETGRSRRQGWMGQAHSVDHRSDLGARSRGTWADGVLWCGTISGGLFRSADRGTSWDLVRPLWDHPTRQNWFGGGADLPGLHSICVDPRDSRTVRVGVSCGGVWLTRDGGASWGAGRTACGRSTCRPSARSIRPSRMHTT